MKEPPVAQYLSNRIGRAVQVGRPLERSEKFSAQFHKAGKSWNYSNTDLYFIGLRRDGL